MNAIYIVGNSRSGTTMMSRILGRHDLVFSFKELHFFGQIYSSATDNNALSTPKAIKLSSRLLSIQRDGYLLQGNYSRFNDEAETIVKSVSPDELFPHKIYEAFLLHETRINGKIIPCEQTPRNLLYINDVFNTFPDARIINMVRDPRDILLSQKNKWKRYFSADKSPAKESLRAWLSYHPITTSMLWNLSVNAINKYQDDNRIITVRFEDILNEPEDMMQKICDFIGIEFNKGMLDIQQIHSSNIKDRSDVKGINTSVAGQWKNGGLSATEIYLCQKINTLLMTRYGYKAEPVRINIFSLLYSIITLPVQLFTALTINMFRIKNILLNAINKILAPLASLLKQKG